MLVVDDCSFNLAAIEGLLEQFKINCELCKDSGKAVESIKKRSSDSKQMYRLILIDFSMPVLDGPNCTKAIRDYLD